MQLLTMQSGGITGQFQPIFQVIDMAKMGNEGAKRCLVIVISDGDASVGALIVPAAEHELQGVKNHSLIQILVWRLIERSGRIAVVVSGLVSRFDWTAPTCPIITSGAREARGCCGSRCASLEVVSASWPWFVLRLFLMAQVQGPMRLNAFQHSLALPSPWQRRP